MAYVLSFKQHSMPGFKSFLNSAEKSINPSRLLPTRSLMPVSKHLLVRRALEFFYSQPGQILGTERYLNSKIPLEIGFGSAYLSKDCDSVRVMVNRRNGSK